ncbi:MULTISPECIES: hypothetical protein [unclassified Micromonospora]|uniref:hypothetical protein n=1 Tax=unclassified Micromonospora TaxID=2617518 RepID=UPI0022B62E86|nr:MULTISPECIES: hypothetical protein [unclassified Micromonospora]MCZ7420284.1 hypothetical protein [Verrucosispora sp. WMMA2121]WBB89209.1 hypothetical protein O7597_19550 [Verrucosispora sp. WMMC514]
MSHRMLPTVVVLVTTVALAACGADQDAPPAAGPAPTLSGPSAAPAAPGAATAPTAAASPAPPGDTAPSGVAPPPPSRPGTAAPKADATTERRPPSPPPVELPPRQAGEPTGREVVAAFRAAGLKAANVRDRSVDCGPDGLGLGCSELVVTDHVAVYVFPDESSAGDLAERWSGAAYRSGTVVLNYLEAPTPPADRPRYEKVLDKLR